MNFEILNAYPEPNSDHDLISQKSLRAVEMALKNHAQLAQALLAGFSQSRDIQQKLEKFKSQFTKFVVVGIGGSSLGIQVLQEYFAKKDFIFIDNVDAYEFDFQLSQLTDYKKTLWLFVSKSGETIETLSTLELIHQFYSEKGLNLGLNSIVITENKESSLNEWAQKNAVLSFEIPMVVGGRYSILSPVGLVPAALMNLDLSALEKGARSAMAQPQLIAQFVAEVLKSFDRKEYITVLWSYSSRLKKFGFWWQQLWAESLGKKLNLKGEAARRASTPLPLIGATDQHSVLQQIAEGSKDKFVIFLRSQMAESGQQQIKSPIFKTSSDLKSKTLGHLLRAEADATQMSLDVLKVSNLTLKSDHHDEENLGFLFMFFQIAVLAIGHELEINPVDQPGVEHGKKLCNQLLADRRN